MQAVVKVEYMTRTLCADLMVHVSGRDPGRRGAENMCAPSVPALGVLSAVYNCTARLDGWRLNWTPGVQQNVESVEPLCGRPRCWLVCLARAHLGSFAEVGVVPVEAKRLLGALRTRGVRRLGADKPHLPARAMRKSARTRTEASRFAKCGLDV